MSEASLLEELTELAQQIRGRDPVPARLELGATAHDELIAHFKAEGNLAEPPPWAPPPLMQSLFGISVVKREDGNAPNAWRLLAGDGQVLCEGTL